MTARLRHLLTAVLLAMHAFVLVGGPGLHGLAGCSHAATAPGHDGDAVTPARLAASVDSCPICHFQLQGATVPPPPPGVRIEVVGRPPIERSGLAAPRPDHRRSAPRAPPIA